MTTKQELKKQIAKLNRQETEMNKEIKATDEFKKIDKERKKLKAKSNKLYDETYKIRKNTTLIYLDNGDRTPQYNDSESWGGYGRNIREETLKAIKKGLGITNLSFLGAKEIENVVVKLIDTKLKNNKEYQDKKIEHGEINDRLDILSIEKDKLFGKTDKVWNERSELYQKLSRIEKREQRRKDLKNPDTKKKAKRWKGEDEARKKLKLIDEKSLDKIHTEVIKHRIVNDLEEEK